jgi:hypothetical protein
MGRFQIGGVTALILTGGLLGCTVHPAAEQSQGALVKPGGTAEVATDAQTAARPNLDKAYQELLTSLEGTVVVRRQQPNNLKAVERNCEDLRRRIADVREAVAAKVSDPATGGQGPATAQAGKAQTGPPTGPVKPSQTPPDPAEAQKRKQATEQGTYLPGPAMAPAKSLRGVPADWVRKQCDEADKIVAELEGLLKKGAPEARTIEDLIGRLQATVDRLATPPPPAPTDKIRRGPGDKGH